MLGSSSSKAPLTLNKIKKDAWVPNELASSCYGCGAEFTITRRIHHCRICGQCFCGSCSSKRLHHSKSAAKAAKARAGDDEVEGADHAPAHSTSSSSFASGKVGSLFKRTLTRAAQGIAALSGPVKPIRVCDTCFETESMLAGAGAGRAQGAGADHMHLDSEGSSADEGSDDDDGSIVWAMGASEASRMPLPQPAHTPSSTSASASTVRKGNLALPNDSDDDEEEATSGAPAQRGRLERSTRQIRLEAPQPNPAHPGVETGGTGPLLSSPSSASSAPTPSPSAAPAPAPAAHSHALCVWNRFFRVGARESVKLVLSDPVLMYLGNKKHVHDFVGLGDGGLFGPAGGGAAGSASGGGTGAGAAGGGSGSGMGAVWNHLRSVVHGHPCAHSCSNHDPAAPPSAHLDCSVPHITRCAESFPFRYGSLVITNYQLLFIPMLVPPAFGAGARSHAVPTEPFRASDSCPQCREAAANPEAAGSASGSRVASASGAPAAPVTTSTCCSVCGCMPLLNGWEHIANNTVACRAQFAPTPSGHHACALPPSLSHHTCLPIAPVSIPLLSLSRFRLRTFERADLGELDLRSKGFIVTRLIFPGLMSRGRMAAFRNIAIALEWFTKVHKHEAAAAAAAAAATLAAQQSAAAAATGDRRAGLLGGNSSINSVELDVVGGGSNGGGGGGGSSSYAHPSADEHEGVGALRKICFAFRWDRERDVPLHQQQQRRAQQTNGHSSSHSASSSRNHAGATLSGKLHAATSQSGTSGGGDADPTTLHPEELLSSDDEADATDADATKGAIGSAVIPSARSRRTALHTGSSRPSFSAGPSLASGAGVGGGVGSTGGGDDSDDDGIEWAPRALTGVEGGGSLAAHEAAQEAHSLACALAAKHARFISAWTPDPSPPLSPSAPPVPVMDGWAIYNPLAEFGRLGLLDYESHYRLSTINVDYSFARTYPSLLVVPRNISDRDLEALAPFRSKARIPAVVWARRNITQPIANHANGGTSHASAQQQHGRPGARGGKFGAVDTLLPVANPEVVMLRAAQPMVGLTRGRNAADELFLQAVAASSPAHRRLVIADARPVANAMAQQVNGKGTELVENYTSHSLRDVTISFLNIGNIHVMRECEEALLKVCQHAAENKFINATGALAQVAEGCSQVRGCGGVNKHCGNIAVSAAEHDDAAEASDLTTPPSIAAALSSAPCPSACTCSCCSVHVGSQHGLSESASSWWGSLLATGHFEHLGAILRGANFIAATIAGGTSTLVHCSDGWDRTSQLTSLSQLLLDPFYRTLRGFLVLIAKEWLAFGHKFSERVGHGGIGGSENSPVFSQWIDCVYQIHAQHSTRFEFTPALLLALRHSLHSGKYGDWLGNCEAERNALIAAAAAAGGGGGGGGGGGDGSTGVSWRLRDKTPSIFTQLWSYRRAFLNPAYEFAPATGRPFEDAGAAEARAHPLQVDLTRLVFWGEYYMSMSAAAQATSDGATAAAMAAATAHTGQPQTLAQAQPMAAPVAAAATAVAPVTAPSATAAVEAEARASQMQAQQESERATIEAAHALALQQQKDAYEARLAEQTRALEQALASLSQLQSLQTGAAAAAAPAPTAAAAVSAPPAADSSAPLAAEAVTATSPILAPAPAPAGDVPAPAYPSDDGDGDGDADDDQPPPPPPPQSTIELGAADASAPAAASVVSSPASPPHGATGPAESGPDVAEVEGLDLDVTRPRAVGRSSTTTANADVAQTIPSPPSSGRAFPVAAVRTLSPIHARSTSAALLLASTSPSPSPSSAAATAAALGAKLRKEGPALPAKLRAVPPPPPLPEHDPDGAESDRRDSECEPPPPPPPIPEEERSASGSPTVPVAAASPSLAACASSRALDESDRDAETAVHDGDAVAAVESASATSDLPLRDEGAAACVDDSRRASVSAPAADAAGRVEES